MRWDNLQPGVGPSPLPLAGAVTRRLDAPEFAGITFHEVQARSILNKVPPKSRMPFRWTINPYRGCSHACSYCMGGMTPILMGNGRTNLIADINVGDIVYGTERRENYRHYVQSRVLAHWSSWRPAYRITLLDGTRLVASADHRFLTGRGWKHVVGAGRGPACRPHLTTGNSLRGVGKFAEPPKDNVPYRRGYLCGMIRGDAHIATHWYSRTNGKRAIAHRFRLALADSEALERTRGYLEEFGVATRKFVFAPATDRRREMTAIRASSRPAVDMIRRIISWPPAPDRHWYAGFLAGIFDAEGSHSRQGILRVCNTDREILDYTRDGLDTFGFHHVTEYPDRDNVLRVIRITGGLREHLRFFHTTDPAITRKRTIDGTAVKTDARLDVVSVEPLGIDIPMYDITTTTGDFIANGVVSHNCFARNTHTYLDLDAGHDFDTQIVVKVNAAERLRAELSRRSWAGEHVAMGTNVDPYQRAEGRYRLMPGIIDALTEAANPFSILTKGTLIQRDLPRLAAASEVTDVAANFSVGSVDETLWRSVEAGTPGPRARLDTVAKLNAAGVPCGVLMAPILPYLSDSPAQLERTVAAIADAGATHVSPIVLHLRSGAREWYLRWLADIHPDLVGRYRELYGDRAYAPKPYQRAIADRVHALAARHGMRRTAPVAARRVRDTSAAPQPEQLTLL